MNYDVVIVGGGPGGLAAALTLGRARKRVLLCDKGPRRNARAAHLQNFVTRDGTPPQEFRDIGRAQLAKYRTVELRDAHVEAVTGAKGSFAVALDDGTTVAARRILLATGMIDEMLPIEGFAELWGHAIYQCPYCHGFEVSDGRFGFLARPEHAAHVLPFVLQLRSWTSDIVMFTNGSFDVPAEIASSLATAKVVVETRPIARLAGSAEAPVSVQLVDGSVVPRDAMFVHPPQRQVPLVTQLGLALDEFGFVQVDPMMRETSVRGIYAGGDLMHRMHSAVLAAGYAMQAAAMINAELSAELVLAGAL